MEKEKYFNEIEHFIKRYEVNKKARVISANYEELEIKWNIGRLLVEAQGGELRAGYGNELIKKWSKIFTEKYGQGYKVSNMKYMRQFFIIYQKGQPVVGQLTWTHYLAILPIKEENKRNYYLNLCIERNLSKRSLINEIKSNSYERLVNKPDHIELIISRKEYSALENMKNPIIIEIYENKKIKSEKELELLILSRLKSFFEQLGNGFALVGNEYKINNYYIDILLFNIELNCYVVVEIKLRELKKEDKAQTEFYMKLVNENLKKAHHNKTIGIIITKEQGEFIANFIRSDNLIPLIYELKER